MQYIDKFWTAFRDKLASFQPDAYTDNDWQEMELLLNGAASTPSNKPFFNFWKLRRGWVLFFLLFTSMVVAYSLWLNQYNKEAQSTFTKVSNESGIASLGDESIAEVEKKAEGINLLSSTEEATDQKAAKVIHAPTQQQIIDEPINKDFQKHTEVKQLTTQQSSLSTIILNTESNNLIVIDSTINDVSIAIEEESLAKQINESLADASDTAIDFLPIVDTDELTTAPYAITDTIRLDTIVRPTWQKAMNYGFSLATTNYNSLGKGLLGVSYGKAYQRKLNEKWDVEIIPTVRWVRVNNSDFSFEVSDTTISINGTVGIVYLDRGLSSYVSFDLPVLLSYHLNERWSLQGGLRGSLLVPIPSSNRLITGKGITVDSQDIESYRKAYMLLPIDVGIVLGAKYTINERWALGLRYAQGLMDISPDNLYLKDITNTNSDLQLSVYRKY